MKRHHLFCEKYKEVWLKHSLMSQFWASEYSKLEERRGYATCKSYRVGLYSAGYINSLDVYLIVEDDHDKHSEQHRLHQQDNVMSSEREREKEDTRPSAQQHQCNGVMATHSHLHDQMLAWRLLALFLCVAFPLVPYSPHPSRHYQHQGVETGHTSSQDRQTKLKATIWGSKHQNLLCVADFRCMHCVLTSVEEKLNEILLV